MISEFWIISSIEDKASQSIINYIINNFPFIQKNEFSINSIIWLKDKEYIIDFEKLKENNPELNSDYKIFKNFIKIRILTTNRKLTFIDNELTENQIENEFKGNFLIFASRHRSESKMPSILTHVTGNWTDDNSHGGFPNTIAIGSGILNYFAIKNLFIQKQEKNLEWPVDLEVNHHGPTNLKSCLIFMELGSSEENDTHPIGSAVVANAIINTIFDFTIFLIKNCDLLEFFHKINESNNVNFSDSRNIISNKQLYQFINDKLKEKKFCFSIGFGGTHYARNFSRILLEQINSGILDKEEVQNKNGNSNIFFITHIVPKYYIQNLTKDLIISYLKNSIEPINNFLLDWNGLDSKNRNHISEISKILNIKILKTKELKFQ